MGQIIFLPIDPPTKTHQQKKVNWRTRSFYEPKELRDVRRMYEKALKPYAPATPETRPVAVGIEWNYKMPKSRKKPGPKFTRPDVDNSAKMLLDCMTRCGFWKDDAQVVQLNLAKHWSTSPGVVVWIKEFVE